MNMNTDTPQTQTPTEVPKKSKKWSTAKIMVGILIILSDLGRLSQGQALFRAGGSETAENWGYNIATVFFIGLAIWFIVSGVKEKSKTDSTK